MTNYFCRVCGTLMYRVGTGFPRASLLRVGTLDDAKLAETKLRPGVEQFTKDRVAWLDGVAGTEKCEAFYYYEDAMKNKPESLKAPGPR